MGRGQGSVGHSSYAGGQVGIEHQLVRRGVYEDGLPVEIVDIESGKSDFPLERFESDPGVLLCGPGGAAPSSQAPPSRARPDTPRSMAG